MLTEKQKYALKMLARGYVIVQDLSGPPNRTYIISRTKPRQYLLTQTLVSLLRSGYVELTRRSWIDEGNVYEITKSGIEALTKGTLGEASRRDIEMNIPPFASREESKRVAAKAKIAVILTDIDDMKIRLNGLVIELRKLQESL